MAETFQITWNRSKYQPWTTKGPNFREISTFSIFVRKSPISKPMNAFDSKSLHLPLFDGPDGRNWHKTEHFG